jgi:hypothetical protein
MVPLLFNQQITFINHKLGLEFDHHEPVNMLQKRMKDITKKLEKKYK